MRFRRWVVFTFVIHVLVVLLDKGAGLILFKLLEDAPHDKGAVDLLTSLPFILTAVANLGLATSSVYLLRKQRFAVTEVAETTSLVAVVWGTLLAGTIVVLSQWVMPYFFPSFSFSLTYVLPIALCVPFLLTTSYFNSVQLAVGRIGDYNVVHLISSAVFLPLFFVFFLAVQAPPAESMAWGRLTSAVVLTLVTVLMLRSVVRWRPRMHGKFFRAAITYGWKANLTSTLSYVNRRLDLYLLGAWFLAGSVVSSPEELRDARLAQVAFYGLAVTFAELVWHFPEAMRDLFFSKVAGSTHIEARRFTPTMCRLCLWAAAVGALVVWLVVDPAMSFLSPTKWDEKWRATVSDCLLILSPGTVTYTVAKILQNDLAARGRLDHCLFACLLEMVVMVTLDALLIPEHGAVGAAWASTIAYCLSSVYTLIAYQACGGASILQCLIPRPADRVYVTDLLAAVREKIAGWRRRT